MTGNRLTLAASNDTIARRSEEEMRAWCWEKNVQARDAKWPHWLYVSRDKDTGTLACKARSGSDATDVINVLNGWYPDFKGWDQDRLDSEFRILRHIARMGMPESEWPARSRRVARAPMNVAS